MTATKPTDALSEAVLSSSPTDIHDLDALAGDAVAGDAGAAFDAPALPLDLISLEAWQDQFASLHDVMGGMVQMRTGQPCPLGAQARSEGGALAGAALYSLMSANPAIARLVLSPNASLWGSVMVVGMHGFACVQIVKTSRAGAGAEAFQG